MKNENLTLFGELLIKQVRDSAIDDILRMADGRMKGEQAHRLRDFLEKPVTRESLLACLLPFVVDRVLYNLLNAVEESDAKVLYAEDGDSEPEELKLISDGLVGELHGNNGWIKLFSAYPRSPISL